MPVSLSTVLLSALVVLVLFFLIFPLVVVVPESFSPTAVLQFPPNGLSLRWYQDFFTGPFWLDALRLSIELGVAVALLSTVVGLLAAVALSRYVTVGRGPLRAIVLSPLIVPVIVTAIALFDVMIRLNLVGTFPGLVLAHTILALPFPVIILENALKSVDPNLEDAAVSLGASRFRAFIQVTLRLIMPSLLGAALFAFMASWDEVVIVLFVGGALMQTLPVKMFEFLTTEVRPTVASASTLLILALIIGLLAIQVRAYARGSRKART
jgi:ABC-type spermidine/putrescine transport system permease subunit II